MTAVRGEQFAGGPYRVALRLAVPTLALLAGCIFNNKLQPLAGEDPKALEVSGDRAAWLDRSGATRAFQDLRQALRDGDGAAVFGLMGPETRAALRAQAQAARTTPEALLASGKAAGLGVPGAPDPLKTLATEGPLAASEADPADPTRRAARVRIRLPGRDEILLPAVYTEGGWRFELVRTETVPPGPIPPPAAGNPS